MGETRVGGNQEEPQIEGGTSDSRVFPPAVRALVAQR